MRTLCILLLSIAAVSGWYVHGMSHRHVLQSTEWTTLESARNERADLFDDFPEEIEAIRYSNAIVGMRGWCFAFVVDARNADLHAFADSLLQSYGAEIIRTEDEPLPFNHGTVEDLWHAYSVKTDWLLEAIPNHGSVYKLADGYGPTIFVDADAGMLYYVTTD